MIATKPNRPLSAHLAAVAEVMTTRRYRLLPVPRDVPEPVAAGERALGPYTLAYEIARGGMGTQYLGCATSANGIRRPVAIKVLRGTTPGAVAGRQMFRDEAELVARVCHANALQFIDAGCDGDREYLVTEYAAGESLERIWATMRSGGAGDDRCAVVVRLIADFAEGLHAVHEAVGDDGQGLDAVHRDVSPSNLLVLYDGTVRVTDFGIASGLHRALVSDPGVFKGKPGYCAPEALEGKRLDRTADVWSLGVLLWELLTLERLFDGESFMEVANHVFEADVPPPSRWAIGVWPELDAIVRRALAPQPAARYATARDLAIALENALALRGAVATPARVACFMAMLFPRGQAYHAQLAHEALVLAASDEVCARANEPTEQARPLPAPAALASPLRARGAPVRGAVATFCFGLALLTLAIAWWSRSIDASTARQPPRAVASAPRTSTVTLPADEIRIEPVAARAEAVDAAESDPAELPPPSRAEPRRIERAREPAAEPSPRGQVLVLADSVADVWVDGVNYGATPRRLELPVGRTTVVVAPRSAEARIPVAVNVTAERPRVIEIASSEAVVRGALE